MDYGFFESQGFDESIYQNTYQHIQRPITTTTQFENATRSRETFIDLTNDEDSNNLQHEVLEAGEPNNFQSNGRSTRRGGHLQQEVEVMNQDSNNRGVLLNENEQSNSLRDRREGGRSRPRGRPRRRRGRSRGEIN